MSSYPPPPSGQPGPPPAPPGMYQASDGRFYPIQGGQPMQPPPPQKKGKGGLIALLVIGAIVVLCGGGLVLAAIAGNSAKDELNKAASTASTQAGAPQTTAAPGAPRTTAAAGGAKAPTTKVGFGDVTITGCALSDNEFLGPEATVKVTNNSSKPSSYVVQIAFVSKDGATQYDTSAVLVNVLAPGQSTQDTAASLKREVRAQAVAGFDCKVLDVTRFAS